MRLDDLLRGLWKILHKVTRRTGEEGQRRDDGVGRDDRVIGNLCAILDDCKFADHTVLSYLHMIANGSRFYDGVGADVNIVSDLHRVIIECTAIRLVRGPHDTSLPHETITPQGDNHGVSRTSALQVTADDGTVRDDRLATENDVLRS